MLDEMALVRIEGVLGRLELSVERLRWDVAKQAVAPAQRATNSAMVPCSEITEILGCVGETDVAKLIRITACVARHQ